jgi:hypothetical protein
MSKQKARIRPVTELESADPATWTAAEEALLKKRNTYSLMINDASWLKSQEASTPSAESQERLYLEGKAFLSEALLHYVADREKVNLPLVSDGASWRRRMAEMRNKKDPQRNARRKQAQDYANIMRKMSPQAIFTKTGMIRCISSETAIPQSTLKDWVEACTLILPLQPSK